MILVSVWMSCAELSAIGRLICEGLDDTSFFAKCSVLSVDVVDPASAGFCV